MWQSCWWLYGSDSLRVCANWSSRCWWRKLSYHICHQHRLVDWWRKFWKWIFIHWLRVQQVYRSCQRWLISTSWGYCVKNPVIKDHFKEKSLSSHMSVKLSVLNYLWIVETKRLKSETETNYMQQVHKLFIPSDPQGPSHKPVYSIPYISSSIPIWYGPYDIGYMIKAISYWPYHMNHMIIKYHICGVLHYRSQI